MSGGSRLSGTRELAWFSRDDPLPFLMMCVRLLLRMIERALRMRPTPVSLTAVPTTQMAGAIGHHREHAKPCERSSLAEWENSSVFSFTQCKAHPWGVCVFTADALGHRMVALK